MNPDKHDGHDSLLFSGDFTGGGNYLEMAYAVPNLDVSSVTMYLNTTNMNFIRLRMQDSSGQWHQVKTSITPGSGWTKWTFSLDRFFAGKTDPSDPTASEYTTWNGANDQKWHGPMTSFNILIEPAGDNKQVAIGISDVTAELKSATPAASQ